jgi:O-acetyl-ADP-ribose deacetylase (regulator of RNase III)/uncharacterized protein YwgA
MITYTKGNLLESDAQALVNTVNTIGVMGKGIALQFKEAYPENFRIYKQACEQGALAPGKLLITRDANAFGEKIIVNFPTKTKWWLKSSYSYVEKGLVALAEAIDEHAIESIAIPPLGCGNGGLKWDIVKALIEKHLSAVSAKVIVFEPNPHIKKELQGKSNSREVKLTPARAMLLYALFQYELKGESVSLFVANKLAYFLQRMGEKLKLNFQPHFYGPYTPQVQHVLYYLNGVYLKGLEQQNAKPFETLILNYDKFEEIQAYISEELNDEQKQRLENLLNFINGFESSYALEVLATVDYILKETPHIEIEAIQEAAEEWSARKTKMLKPEYVKLAQKHLLSYQEQALF